MVYTRNQLKKIAESSNTQENLSKSDEEINISSEAPMLTEANYYLWKSRVRIELKQRGLWHVVKEEVILEDEDNDIAIKRNAKRRTDMMKAEGVIEKYLNMTKADEMEKNPEINTPHKIWKKLEEEDQTQNKPKKQNLRMQLITFRWKSPRVNENYNRFLNLASQYEAAGGSMSESEKIELFCACVPRKFIQIADIQMEKQGNTLQQVVSAFETKERRTKLAQELNTLESDNKRKGYGKHIHKFQSRNVGQKTRKGEEALQCTYCKKKNHNVKNCWKKQKDEKAKKEANCVKKVEETNNVTLEAREASRQTMEIVLNANIPNVEEWIIDSGATRHMTFCKETIHDLETRSDLGFVRAAGGKLLKVRGQGTVYIQGYNSDNELRLKDVLFVPSLMRNLFSVPAASNKNCKVEFYKDKAKLIKDGKILMTAKREGSLYIMDGKPVVVDQEREVNISIDESCEIQGTPEEIHKKLCHFGSFPDCRSCQLGKMHRTYAKVYSEEKPTEPLERVHTDVMQMTGSLSQGGNKYVLNFIDDYTRYAVVYFLKKKSEVFNMFKRYVENIELQSGHKVKELRDDKGGEYISNEMYEWMESRGIKTSETHRNSPHENGIAERYNRTMNDAARTMIIEAGASETMWAEAISTANYVKNRIKHSKTHKVPYEEIFQKKPMMKHLQSWGCDAIIYDQKTTGKMQSRGRIVRFIGYNEYNSKGYKFIDPKTEEIILSNDVKFLKSPNITDETREYESGVGQPIEEAILVEEGPPNYYAAMQSDEAGKWKAAMDLELQQLRDHNTWSEVTRPKDAKVIPCKWVLRRKINADGSYGKYKARLVILGNLQRPGSDFGETFSPVARMETIRIVIAVALARGYSLYQMDVKNAYLNGKVDREIFMSKIPGYSTDNNKVLKLNKSLYGLKQAGRLWNEEFCKFMKECGLRQSKADPCVFCNHKIIVCLYVDDITMAGMDKDVQDFKSKLKSKFKMEDMGKLKDLLGIKIVQQSDKVMLTQDGYITKVLEKFNMKHCKPVSTPMVPNENIHEYKKLNNDEDTPQGYRELIGSLLYLANGTRPDIAFAVNQLSQYVTNPTLQHWTALKRILRYVQGTKSLGLEYIRQYSEKVYIEAFSDASYGSGKDRKSVSGIFIRINNCPIIWSSRKQSITAQSTVEAEYVALSETSKQVAWVAQMLSELGIEYQKPIKMNEDNQGTIALTNNPILSRRSKHIDIRYHYIREQLKNGLITLSYCPTTEMVADLLTKSLAKPILESLRSMMSLSYSSSRGSVGVSQ